ncbi:MAG: hypothetical protein JWO02_3857 [Solirubrobacterales bacterium]|nr:hypothetical protein [Solirubrobacterales bacterium]
MSRLDRTSLVAGLALIVLGVLFLLDRTGTLDVRFGALWPLLTGAAGAILLTAGLDDRRRG